MLEGDELSAAHPGRTLPPGKTRYPLYRRLGGPQGRSGRAKILASTGIRSPDRPARSQSLYRLSYPTHIICNTVWHSWVICSDVEVWCLESKHAWKVTRSLVCVFLLALRIFESLPVIYLTCVLNYRLGILWKPESRAALFVVYCRSVSFHV